MINNGENPEVKEGLTFEKIDNFKYSGATII